MKSFRAFFFLLLFLISAVPAGATPHLVEWGFNDNGRVYTANDATSPLDQYLPAHFNITGFDWNVGLGVITITYASAGEYKFVSYFDHEIVQGQNTFFNEHGQEVGSPQTGQSWEIDQPGWVFGDIHDHLLSGELDSANSVPVGSENDVSFAMGWEFSLPANAVAVITLTLSKEIPLTSFYLAHGDPEGIHYFSSALSVTSGVPVPEPCSILLFSAGLAGLAGIRGSVNFR